MLTPHPGILQNIKDGGWTKTAMNVYNMHIHYFCRIGFLQKKYYELVERTIQIKYILFSCEFYKQIHSLQIF